MASRALAGGGGGPAPAGGPGGARRPPARGRGGEHDGVDADHDGDHGAGAGLEQLAPRRAQEQREAGRAEAAEEKGDAARERQEVFGQGVGGSLAVFSHRGDDDLDLGDRHVRAEGGHRGHGQHVQEHQHHQQDEADLQEARDQGFHHEDSLEHAAGNHMSHLAHDDREALHARIGSRGLHHDEELEHLASKKHKRIKTIRCDCKLIWCAEQRSRRLQEMKAAVPGWPQYFASPKCPLQRHEVLQTLRPNTPEKSKKSNFIFLWWHLRPSSFMWVANFDKRTKNRTPRWMVGRQKINVSPVCEPAPRPETFALYDREGRQWIPAPDSPLAESNCLVTLYDPSTPDRAKLAHSFTAKQPSSKLVGRKRARIESHVSGGARVRADGSLLALIEQTVQREDQPQTLEEAKAQLLFCKNLLARVYELNSGAGAVLPDMTLTNSGGRALSSRELI